MLNIENLGLKYQEATISGKREIIGSIYPENIVFDGNNYRTARINSVIGLIYTLKADFDIKKARYRSKSASIPRLVTWERIELSTH